MKKLSLATLALTALLNLSFSQEVTWEIFKGLAGGFPAVSSTAITPTKVYTNLTILGTTGITTGLDGYLSRIKGYIKIPATGNYTFYIASDDGSEFWLSTNADSANKVKIAYATSYQGNYTSTPAQKSAPIYMVEGGYYYFEALHSEGSGNDFVKVGWTRPGEAAATINDVPASVLSKTGLPLITITNIPVPSGRIPQGNKNIILYKNSVAVHQNNALLKSITFSTNGTYTTSDVINFKLWYSKTTPVLDSAKQIGKTILSCASGADLLFDSLFLNIKTVDSLFFLVTADVTANATLNATINIKETYFSKYFFNGTVKKIANPDTILPAGGLKKIEKISVESVKISKDTLTLVAGQTSTLTAKIFPDSSSVKEIIWSSDDISKALVDPNGKITTLIDGKVNIIVTTKDGEKKDTCILTIQGNNTSLKNLYLDPGILSIDAGESITINVITDPIFISRATLKWKSSDEQIATIDNNGLLTSIKPGKAIITATMQGTKQAMCVVNVSEPFKVNLNEEGISIYPIPATEFLTIRQNEPTLSKVELYNMQGILVQSALLENDIITLDISNLPSGIYIIKIRSEKRLYQRMINVN